MDLRSLTRAAPVQSARARILADEQETFREQLRIVAIPAPTLEESTRAEYLRTRMLEAGLTGVSRDEVGNVLGALPRPADPDAAPVVIAAHLDTVFPAGTDLTPHMEAARAYAPGIADNARGLAALLGLAAALAQSGVRTLRPVWFVGTVGEEGNGDLRGVKHLFRSGSAFQRAAGFVALDGTGVRKVVHRAIGARRFRFTVAGPGGHSWADWGVGNPLHALGSAVAALDRMSVPQSPRSTLTVARIQGGTSINTIPAEAWLELDLRSEESSVLDRLGEAAREVVAHAVREENQGRRRGSPALRLDVRLVGDRPAGAVDETSGLVRAAVAATRAVGARPELAASSTDANVPISLGIPAVTLGAGGESGGIHTVREWYANRDAARGVERALLTVLAVAELAPETAGNGGLSSPTR